MKSCDFYCKRHTLAWIHVVWAILCEGPLGVWPLEPRSKKVRKSREAPIGITQPVILWLCAPPPGRARRQHKSVCPFRTSIYLKSESQFSGDMTRTPENMRSKRRIKVTGNENIKIVFTHIFWKADRLLIEQHQNDLRPITHKLLNTFYQRKRVIFAIFVFLKIVFFANSSETEGHFSVLLGTPISFQVSYFTIAK